MTFGDRFQQQAWVKDGDADVEEERVDESAGTSDAGDSATTATGEPAATAEHSSSPSSEQAAVPKKKKKSAKAERAPSCLQQVSARLPDQSLVKAVVMIGVAVYFLVALSIALEDRRAAARHGEPLAPVFPSRRHAPAAPRAPSRPLDRFGRPLSRYELPKPPPGPPFVWNPDEWPRVKACGTEERFDKAGDWYEVPSAHEQYSWLPRKGLPWAAYDTPMAVECLGEEGIAVIGDSTARFFYSALVDALNVTREHRKKQPLPLHYLPAEDECSMPATKFAWDDTPVRWGGAACTDPDACCHRWPMADWSHNHPLVTGCSPHSGGGSKKTCTSFMWMSSIQEGMSVKRLDAICASKMRQVPRTIVVALGLWDLQYVRSVDNKIQQQTASLPEIAAALRPLLAKVRAQCTAADAFQAQKQRFVFLGPSACPHTRDGLSGPEAVRNVYRLNAVLESVVANTGRPWMYIDRSASQASAPHMDTSMCHKHHAHGYLSDLHVQMVLNSLCDHSEKTGRVTPKRMVPKCG